MEKMVFFGFRLNSNMLNIPFVFILKLVEMHSGNTYFQCISVICMSANVLLVYESVSVRGRAVRL